MATEKQLNVKKGILLTIAYAFVMSISTAAAKQSQTLIAVPTLLFWQSVLCCAMVLPHMRGRKVSLSLSGWAITFLRSFSGFAALMCFYWALNHIPMVEASLLRACAPLCVPFVVLVIYKKLIPRQRWLPLIVGFIGAAIVIHPTPSNVSVWHIVAFLSAVGLAVSMVTTRILSQHLSPHGAMMAYFGFSCLMSLGLVLIRGDSLILPQAAWLWVLAVAISLYYGMYLYTQAYTSAPASIVSPVSYSGIVFNGFWGWLIWQHLPDIYAWIGTVFIFGSILVSSRLNR